MEEPAVTPCPRNSELLDGAGVVSRTEETVGGAVVEEEGMVQEEEHPESQGRAHMPSRERERQVQEGIIKPELSETGWRAHMPSRERVRRVLEEMEWHEGGRGKTLTSCAAEEADDAESVKVCLREAYRREANTWQTGGTLTSTIWGRV